MSRTIYSILARIMKSVVMDILFLENAVGSIVTLTFILIGLGDVIVLQRHIGRASLFFFVQSNAIQVKDD